MLFLPFLPHETQLLSWALYLGSANIHVCSKFKMPEIGICLLNNGVLQ